jgi:hypothetical protein
MKVAEAVADVGALVEVELLVMNAFCYCIKEHEEVSNLFGNDCCPRSFSLMSP